MSNTTLASGIDAGAAFKSVMTGLDQDGQRIQQQLNDLSASENVSNEDLLRMQFAMGQYSAKVTALSEIQKSITDMLKSLAQKAGG